MDCIANGKVSPFLIHRFAVPLPPGGRYCAALVLTNTNFTGTRAKTIITIFKIIPGGDTESYILYLVSYILVPCAFGDGRLPPRGNVINLRNQGLISLSLRTSPQTGVAIRSPCSVPISNMLPRRKRIATSLRSSQ